MTLTAIDVGNELADWAETKLLLSSRVLFTCCRFAGFGTLLPYAALSST